MSKKETKTEKPVEVENPRLAEIEAELKLLQKRRVDYAHYLNTKGKTVKTVRNHTAISQRLFEQESKLKAEKSKLLKGGK